MEEENDELCLEITLNYQGNDYIAVVNAETAHVLLNDQNEADKFVQNYIIDAKPENTQHNFPKPGGSKEDKIWKMKRPTEKDNNATEFFLKLRQRYSDKFDDRKTIKSQIYLIIAEKMRQEGYNVGEGKEAIEKLRLKFSSLQRQYLNYKLHTKTTGEGKKDPPPFYDLLNEILGDKHKVDPHNLVDSLDNESNEKIELHVLETDSGSLSEPSVCEIKNRFKKKHVKPKSNTEKLLEFIRKKSDDDKEEKKEHIKRFENLLQIQNEQRERFLNQFERFIDIKSKKRKREIDSSDSD